MGSLKINDSVNEAATMSNDFSVDMDILEASKIKSEFLSFKEAKEILKNDKYSCFELVTTKKHIILSPKYVCSVKKGIYEQLDTEIKKYDDSLDGVLIAYNNVKLYQRFGLIVSSDPFLHFDIQADFIVFRPKPDSSVKVVINKASQVHFGGLVHGYFNLTMARHASSARVRVGDEMVCKVTKVYNNSGMICMRGNPWLSSFQSQSLEVNAVTQEIALESQKRKADEMDEEDDPLPEIQPKKKRKKHAKHDLEGDLSVSSPGGALMTSTPGPGGDARHKKMIAPGSNVSVVTSGGEDTLMDVTDSSKKEKKKKKKKISEKYDMSEDMNESVTKKKKHRKRQDKSLDMSSSGMFRKDSSDVHSDVTEDSGIAVNNQVFVREELFTSDQNTVKKHKIKTEIMETDGVLEHDIKDISISSAKKKKHKKKTQS